MRPVLESLPILILDVFSRCNCRCAMCDIWRRDSAEAMSPDDIARQLPAIRKLNVKWVVMTGGEPLMHPHLFEICAPLREMGIRVTMLTTGLLLARYAEEIARHVDDVIVSLDGPAEVHNQIRRVPDAFERLRDGIRTLRRVRADFPVSARCTVQRANACCLMESVAAAREIGCDSISFLAVDTESSAFNRNAGVLRQIANGVAPRMEDLAALSEEVEGLVASGECGRFIAESPEKLRRIVRHFRAALGVEEPVAPMCNAPWVSAVMDWRGAVRPCFFHAATGSTANGIGLDEAINGPDAIAFRSRLNIAGNEICRRCVCSLNWKG